MKQYDFVVTDAEGLHARPAGMLVKRTAGFESSITLKKHSDGKVADAKKMFAVMALCAKQGETLTVTVEGADEDAVTADLETFFKENA